ncbi:MAG TPA: hypothetical protein VJP79_11680 [Nitrososphaera sp.]|nr:hypothetical protein [Nitrososphaera sp.]
MKVARKEESYLTRQPAAKRQTDAQDPEAQSQTGYWKGVSNIFGRFGVE